MRSRLVMTTVVAVALACLAAPILAQQPGGQRGQPGGQGRGGGFGGGGFGGFGGGGGGFGGTSRLRLLAIAEVQKELELVDEQVTAIAKVREELQPMGRGRGGQRGGEGGQPGQPGGRGRRGANPPAPPSGASLAAPAEWYFVQEAQQPQRQGRGGFTPPTPEEAAQQAKERAERLKQEMDKLAEILLPHQMKRLNEIYYQQLGVGVVDAPDAVAELKITDEQKAKIATVRTENRAAMQEIFGGGAGGGAGGGRGGFGNITEEQRTKFAEVTKKNDEKILAVLTAEQTKKLEELKGKAFAMPENAGRGGRGGPGGAGGAPGAPGARRGGNPPANPNP